MYKCLDVYVSIVQYIDMSTTQRKVIVYSVMSQKGGAGKTTLAINLAVQSKLEGKNSLIVDIDPQASATKWSYIRGEDNTPLVTTAFASRLHKVIEVAKDNDIDEIFIDTPPHAQRDAQIASEISDVVLIPCRPNLFDLQAIEDTIGLADMAKKPFILVFNAIHHTSPVAKDAKDAIQSKYGNDINICPQMLVQRLCYVHASVVGQGVQEYDKNSKASLELMNVYKYVCGHDYNNE